MSPARFIPSPDCEGGYSIPRLETFLDPEQLKELWAWMDGQTYMLCEGRAYNHDTREYEEACGGVAHGPVIYPSDVHRFLHKLPIVD